MTSPKMRDNKVLEDPKEVYELLSHWGMPIDDVKIVDGADEVVAQQWMDDNEDKVNEMIGK